MNSKYKSVLISALCLLSFFNTSLAKAEFQVDTPRVLTPAEQAAAKAAKTGPGVKPGGPGRPGGALTEVTPDPDKKDPNKKEGEKPPDAMPKEKPTEIKKQVGRSLKAGADLRQVEQDVGNNGALSTVEQRTSFNQANMMQQVQYQKFKEETKQYAKKDQQDAQNLFLASFLLGRGMTPPPQPGQSSGNSPKKEVSSQIGYDDSPKPQKIAAIPDFKVPGSLAPDSTGSVGYSTSTSPSSPNGSGITINIKDAEIVAAGADPNAAANATDPNATATAPTADSLSTDQKLQLFVNLAQPSDKIDGNKAPTAVDKIGQDPASTSDQKPRSILAYGDSNSTGKTNLIPTQKNSDTTEEPKLTSRSILLAAVAKELDKKLKKNNALSNTGAATNLAGLGAGVGSLASATDNTGSLPSVSIPTATTSDATNGIILSGTPYLPQSNGPVVSNPTSPKESDANQSDPDRSPSSTIDEPSQFTHLITQHASSPFGLGLLLTLSLIGAWKIIAAPSNRRK